MATNADPSVAVDDSPTTEEDLRNLKYGDTEVETTKVEDEPEEPEETQEESDKGEEDGQTDTPAEEESQDDSQFVKELPSIAGDTLEEYARNLEKAYQNSTTEALRLKGLADKAQKPKEDNKEAEIDISNPLTLYAKQKMDEEISNAFQDFSKQYSQVNDPAEYDKFTGKVAILSRTIMESENRLASPSELYSTAAVLLGWDKESTPSSKEKIGMAVKSTAAVSKTSSAVKTTSKSKVTDEMIAVNRAMYPDKTDAQIREELEPFVK